MKLIVSTVPYKPPDFGNFSKEKYSATKTVPHDGSFTVKNVEPSGLGDIGTGSRVHHGQVYHRADT